jgi:protein-ribulosamine 3-kinase
MSPDLQSACAAAIRAARGEAFRIASVRPVSGGCIDAAWRIEGAGMPFFVKTGNGCADRFAAEADGLAALARCSALAVPGVVAIGAGDGSDFLVLEWLEIVPSGDAGRLGEALAELHSITLPTFGWHRDNYIGSSPQQNAPDSDWVRFFRERRLRPQLRMAAANGAPRLEQAAGDLLDRLEDFFPDGQPLPALLHGDLWRGNCGFSGGRPCLFDPAVHAGDPACDLAMAELFGGLSPDFFAGYRACRPDEACDDARRMLYQLYHVINHYNLFGGCYRDHAGRLIQALVERLRC